MCMRFFLGVWVCGWLFFIRSTVEEMEILDSLSMITVYAAFFAATNSDTTVLRSLAARGQFMMYDILTENCQQDKCR